MNPCHALLPLLLATALAAQLQPGDIGVAGFSTSQFGVLSNGVATGYTTPGFQGSNAATSQAILWDPIQPGFLIGGFGFVGRATISAGGVVSYQLLTNQVNTAAQLSFGPPGQLWIADAGTDQVRSLDLATNAVTDLTSGAQPWGTTLNAGCFDPFTGDFVVGNSGGLYRLTPSTGAVVPIATNLGGFVSAVAIDLATSEVVATVLTANRLVRIDPLGNAIDIAPPGTVTTPNALEQGLTGEWLVGGTAGRVFSIPYQGGPATLLGSITTPSTNVSGLSVVRGGGSGVIPFGAACLGAGGPVQLTLQGNLAPGASVALTSNNHAPNQLGVAIFGLSTTTYNGSALPFALDPLLGTVGCFLNVAIDATAIGISSAATPAVLSFPLQLPPLPTGAIFHVQHACFEPVPGGLSWSNGLSLLLP